MSVRRPIIGITTSYDPLRERFEIRDDYVRAVELAGGAPLVLATVAGAQPEHLATLIDGLILTGGADVDPARYGALPHSTVDEVLPERDEFEIALCRTALSSTLPTLAICRGQQVLNVAAGGTLVQDVPSLCQGALNHDPGGDRWSLAHEVAVEPGTRLSHIFGKDRFPVNSVHHQAVDRVGSGLRVSARSSDGVIEGLEAADGRFVVAVQWHPESFWDHREVADFQPLFGSLVDEARASRR